MILHRLLLRHCGTDVHKFHSKLRMTAAVFLDSAETLFTDQLSHGAYSALHMQARLKIDV